MSLHSMPRHFPEHFPQGNPREASLIDVERALAELRAGRPIFITSAHGAILAQGIEGFDAAQAMRFTTFSGSRARLVLTGARLRRLGVDRPQGGALALPAIDPTRIEMLALHVEARLDAPVGLASPLDTAALELARLALIVPAVVCVAVAFSDIDDTRFLRVDAAAIADFRGSGLRDLRIVGRAPVPLEGARNSEFVIFRGGEGLRDQVAVIVGKPDLTKPVTVRLHSACLTGDLFGSLKCDCGDQLRDTVQAMAAGEGGILLYLDQEGRGNGIANKMRAYRLQAQGFDTYDADEVLGFEHDPRRFDFAALMLKQLGVTQVRVMTNNPVKIEALQRAGLDVVSDHRIHGRSTDENIRYLASKRDRQGHFLDPAVSATKAGAGE
jgi:GTP cyclohydrolase II